jgi:hypothetical protein
VGAWLGDNSDWGADFGDAARSSKLKAQGGKPKAKAQSSKLKVQKKLKAPNPKLGSQGSGQIRSKW